MTSTVLLIYFAVDVSDPPRDTDGTPLADDTNGQMVEEPTIARFTLEGDAGKLSVLAAIDREVILNMTETHPHDHSAVVFVQTTVDEDTGEETVVSANHVTGEALGVVSQAIHMTAPPAKKNAKAK